MEKLKCQTAFSLFLLFFISFSADSQTNRDSIKGIINRYAQVTAFDTCEAQLTVSDTTPLSVFLRIGRPDILTALFDRLRVPQAVAMELDRGTSILGDWRSSLPFVDIGTTGDATIVRLLLAELDAGEAEAIACSRHSGSDAT